MIQVGVLTLDRSKVMTDTKSDTKLLQVRVMWREAKNIASVKQVDR